MVLIEVTILFKMKCAFVSSCMIPSQTLETEDWSDEGLAVRGFPAVTGPSGFTGTVRWLICCLPSVHWLNTMDTQAWLALLCTIGMRVFTCLLFPSRTGGRRENDKEVWVWASFTAAPSLQFMAACGGNWGYKTEAVGKAVKRSHSSL